MIRDAPYNNFCLFMKCFYDYALKNVYLLIPRHCRMCSLTLTQKFSICLLKIKKRYQDKIYKKGLPSIHSFSAGQADVCAFDRMSHYSRNIQR